VGVLKDVVAEFCKDIQVDIPDYVEWMRNPNEEVSNSVLKLLSEFVPHCRYHYCCVVDKLITQLYFTAHLSDAMQIVTFFLLESMQAHTINFSTSLIHYLSKFLDFTLKHEEVQAD